MIWYGGYAEEQILLSFRDSNRTTHGWNDMKSAVFFKITSLSMNGSESGCRQKKTGHDNKFLKLGDGDLGAHYRTLEGTKEHQNLKWQKKKTDKVDFPQMKNNCASNGTIEKVKDKNKTKTTEREKYLLIIYLIKDS